MALWKAREGKFIKSQILDQSVKIKSWILDHGIVEGRGGSVNKELEFRSWHCGRQAGGSLNKELDFASWHCGRQGGSSNKELEFRSWHCGRQGGEVEIKS